MSVPGPSGRPRSLGQRLSDRAEMIAIRLTLRLTAPFETDRFVRGAGAFGRWLTPRLPILHRRIAANLRDLGREGEAKALSAEVGDNFFRLIAEYMRLDAVAARTDRVRIAGAEHLTAPLAQGRGVVVAGAHFGNWEAVRIAVRMAAGRDCALIYRAFNNPRFDAIAQDLIRHAGEPVLHKGREGTRGLLRHVARGGAAMVLVDQRQTGAPLLPFLGVPAETATAAAELALRFNASLITARARRAEDGLSFDVAFEPPVDRSDAETMMAEVNARVSAWIEADPGQWFWLHRRWKLRDRGGRIRAARDGASGSGATDGGA